MKLSDKTRFAQIMMGMADNFRDSITKEGMALRFDVLKQFSIQQVEAAARKILLTRKYTKMPPIAEFIEAIQGQAPALEDQALVIATEIVSHLKRYGAGSFPKLDHDPTAQRLMTTRWPYRQWAASVLESELKWWIKEFCEAYRSETVVERREIEGPAELKKIATAVFQSISGCD